MDGSYFSNNDITWKFNYFQRGISCCTVHLYNILNQKMYILGISAHYHDSAACLIKDGEILFAAQEERFSRIKHDSNFPKAAIKFCLKEANIKPDLIGSFVFYEKPILKFDILIETYFSYAPLGFKSFRKSIPLWVLIF